MSRENFIVVLVAKNIFIPAIIIRVVNVNTTEDLCFLRHFSGLNVVSKVEWT